MSYKESVIVTGYSHSRQYRANSTSDWSTTGTWTGSFTEGQQTQGESTPNFHARKRRGELLPFTRFVQLEQKRTYDSGKYHVRNVSSNEEFRFTGQRPAYDASYTMTLSTAASAGSGKTDSDSIMQAAASRQVSSGWDVLTFAAEMGQTVSMFKNLLTKVTDLIRAKPPGTPWNLWLEARYGWRTLAYDMQDIEQAFSKRKPSTFFKTSAGRSISWVVDTDNGTDSGSGAKYVYYTKDEYSVNGRGRVISRSQPPRFQINILKTAWEVTRLSFVVDWFINVGRFIDALSFALTVDRYEAGFGEEVQLKHTGGRIITPLSGWVNVDTPDFKSVHEVMIQRRAPASIPLIPLVSPNLDTFKVLDLVMLLIQQLRR